MDVRCCSFFLLLALVLVPQQLHWQYGNVRVIIKIKSRLKKLYCMSYNKYWTFDIDYEPEWRFYDNKYIYTYIWIITDMCEWHISIDSFSLLFLLMLIVVVLCVVFIWSWEWGEKYYFLRDSIDSSFWCETNRLFNFSRSFHEHFWSNGLLCIFFIFCLYLFNLPFVYLFLLPSVFLSVIY